MKRIFYRALLALLCFGPLSPTVAEQTVSVPLWVILDDRFLADAPESELKIRMGQYVKDINKIFAVNTVRRWTYDPNVNFRLFTDSYDPVTKIGTAGYGGGSTLQEQTRFTIMISKAGNGYVEGYGNAAPFTFKKWLPEPAFHAAWLRATKTIWPLSVTTVPQSSYHDYTRDIVVLAHELGHLHGLGYMEWYDFTNFFDSTGVEPQLRLKSMNKAIPDGDYLKQRSLMTYDPMHGMDRSRPNVFTPINAALINMTARQDQRYWLREPRNDPRYWSRSLPPSEVTDKLGTKIKVFAKNASGRAIPGCRVRIWGHQVSSHYYWKHRLLWDGTTNADGRYEAPYYDANKPTEIMVRTVKVHCKGYLATGDILSRYDIDAHYIMPNGGAANDFHYNGQMEFTMPAAGRYQNGPFPNDVNADGSVTAIDALLIMNEINNNGPHSLTTAGPEPTVFWDVNGDNFVSAVDVNTVITCLNTPNCPKSW